MSQVQLPPADVDAEAAVLCASLLEPDSLQDALSVLEEGHYYLDAHQRVWAAIRSLHEEERKVDVTAVAGRLRDMGRLDQIGGTPFLFGLLNAPAVGSVLEHAQQVRNKWRLRELINHCRTTAVEAYGATDVDSHISDHTEKLEAITQAKATDTQATIKEALRNVVQEYHHRAKNKDSVPGVPTGLLELDHKIGGWKRGNMYVIAARPGIGKTGFSVTTALAAARKGFGVAFISLEMPRNQLAARAVAQEARLDTQLIDSGKLSFADADLFTATAANLSALPLVFDDDAVQTPTSLRSAVRRCLRRLRREHPAVNLGLIVVDYLQIMTPSKTKRQSSREQDVTEMSSACLKLAREFNAPVLALSQLNRGVESRPDKRPMLSDLRESGAIEQDAFGVLMLYREDYYRKDGEEPDGEAEILVRKMRQGGATGTVKAAFHAPSTSFGNLIPDYQRHYSDFER